MYEVRLARRAARALSALQRRDQPLVPAIARVKRPKLRRHVMEEHPHEAVVRPEPFGEVGSGLRAQRLRASPPMAPLGRGVREHVALLRHPRVNVHIEAQGLCMQFHPLNRAFMVKTPIPQNLSRAWLQ